MKEKWEKFKTWLEKNKVAAGLGSVGLIALFYWWYKSRTGSSTETGEVATMSYSPGSGGSGGGSSGTSTTSSDVETISTVLEAGLKAQQTSLEGFLEAMARSQAQYTGQRNTPSAMTPNIPTPAPSASFAPPASIIGADIIPWEQNWEVIFTPASYPTLSDPAPNAVVAGPPAPPTARPGTNVATGNQYVQTTDGTGRRVNGYGEYVY